jgi:hypothetical protein
MRQPWFPALCRRRLLGVILAGGLALTGFGCCQHYHYYGSSACGPATTMLPSTVQSSPIDDAGTQVVEGGTKVGAGSTISSSVAGTKSSRVVVSEPRNAWKRSDPDGSVATTSVEGTLNDSTIKQ